VSVGGQSWPRPRVAPLTGSRGDSTLFADTVRLAEQLGTKQSPQRGGGLRSRIAELQHEIQLCPRPSLSHAQVRMWRSDREKKIRLLRPLRNETRGCSVRTRAGSI